MIQKHFQKINVKWTEILLMISLQSVDIQPLNKNWQGIIDNLNEVANDGDEKLSTRNNANVLKEKFT